MLRKLYIYLLWMHPARFRSRFGDEMLADFDEAREAVGSWPLVADGILSLFRQWVFRPHIPSHAALQQHSVVPVTMFHTIEDYRLSTGAKVNGALLSIILLSAAILAIGRGGANTPLFLIGAYGSRPSLLPVNRASLVESELDTQIRIPARREDPWRAVAVLYFKAIWVLSALDRNGDYDISRHEIAAARAALLKLDTDRDGKLSPEECGFILGDPARIELGPDVVRRARLDFMHGNPVFSTVDIDKNGELTAGELNQARSTLKTLDRNGDGTLTPHELIPGLVSRHASIILSRLDKNADDTISLTEWMEVNAEPLRKVVEAADRNRDGIITRQELESRLQLSQEVKSRLDRALRGNP